MQGSDRAADKTTDALPVNYDRLRRLPRTATALVRRRRRASALVGLVVLVGSFTLLGVAIRATQPPPATNPGPSFTYATSWTLLELQSHIDSGEVVAISSGETGADALVAKTRDGQLVRVVLTVGAGDAAGALAAIGHGELLTKEAWDAIAARPAPGSGDVLRTLAAWTVPLLMLAFLIVMIGRGRIRGLGGGREAQSQFMTIMPAKAGAAAGDAVAAGPVLITGGPSVRLDDVAGVEEAKVELAEAIEFLKSPERFHKLGARIPRGIMLYGPPGTGKTMLARAVAAEAGVPFHYASGSEFVEKYVGVGARRIRDIFAHARKLGRGVIFFDEFDAIGKARGGQNSHDEREQTLNQLLVELDGFATTDEVVVIAATNRLDILDAAVLRPGRFNRKIHVGLPDVKGRRDILEVHSRNKPLTVAVDLEGLARKTYGFSGAQLADLLNESAILAARRGGLTIDPDDVHGGWMKVAVGTARRRSMDERERSIIAAHEVGHAICGRVLGDKRKIEEISLYAHGEALGVTVSSQEDNDLPSESDVRSRLVALMGGRAAEELLFHEVTGGAANDFDKANQIAVTMVTKWGMGRDPDATEFGSSGRGSLGFIVARPNGSFPSEVQAAATRAIRGILDEAYAEACRTLLEHMDTLRRLSAYLVEHERVDGETFEELFDGRRDVPNGLAEWRPAVSRPRAWADIPAYHEGRGALLRAPAAPLAPVAAAVTPVGSGIPGDAEPADAVPAQLPRIRSIPQRGRRTSVAAAATADGAGSRVAGHPIRRRLRGIAAGYLHAAESWLLSSEAPDRS